jgi:hypothetical protein
MTKEEIEAIIIAHKALKDSKRSEDTQSKSDPVPDSLDNKPSKEI